MADDDIDALVRVRLRSLRRARGWSLDALGARANLSPSVISRIETGKRSIGLDVLVSLAKALQIDLDALLDVDADDDVVIRPVADHSDGVTVWPLSRPDGPTTVFKMRLEPPEHPRDHEPDLRVHPGFDWFYVVEGRVALSLGERTIAVETGEAAEFSTMTPHAILAVGGPAELVMTFDRDGQQAHLHAEG